MPMKWSDIMSLDSTKENLSKNTKEKEEQDMSAIKIEVQPVPTYKTPSQEKVMEKLKKINEKYKNTLKDLAK